MRMVLMKLINFLFKEFSLKRKTKNCLWSFLRKSNWKEWGGALKNWVAPCWCLFCPYLSPSYINEVTGKTKITFLIMELREGRNKKQISKEAITVTVERPHQLRIQSGTVNQVVWKIGVQSPCEEWWPQETQRVVVQQSSVLLGCFGEEAVKSRYVDIISGDFNFEEILIHINLALEKC